MSSINFIQLILSNFGLFCVKSFILLYDALTTPFYALYQRPWNKIHQSTRIRSRLTNPNDPYSPYVRVTSKESEIRSFELSEVTTIPQLQQYVLRSFPLKQKSLGYRVIRDVQKIADLKTGKFLMKYDLESEYRWFSNEEVDRMIGQLTRGFLKHEVKFQEPVVIFAETRIGNSQ